MSKAIRVTKMMLKDIKHLKKYTLGEEIANSVTHGLGVIFSIIGFVVLIVNAEKEGGHWRLFSFAVFGTALIFLYLVSTLYHSIPGEKVKRYLKVLDHSAIFILIAGTYTPFTLVNLRGAWGWSLFAIIWTLAISGVIIKLVWFSRFQRISVVIYILMGWLIIIASRQVIEHVNSLSLLLLLIGGLCYTGGTIFYVWRKLPYNHAIWHLFVLGGSVSHFFAILYS